MNGQRVGLASLDIRSHYRTGMENPILAFLRSSLAVAHQYDRAVGYFRTSILPLIGPSLAEMALRGGRVRIVASPTLNEEDIEAVRLGRMLSHDLVRSQVERQVRSWLDEPGTADAAKVLATLYHFDALDIRLALRRTARGIYHEKIGVFVDEAGNALSFVGSANETYAAMVDEVNFESVEVFRTWADDGESSRVDRHRQYFEQLWEGVTQGLEIVALDDAAAEILHEAAHNSIEAAVAALRREGATTAHGIRPRPHQAEAVRNWIAQGYQGIFEHATGSGKTVSALIAMKGHLEAGGPVVILVPSTLLVVQWSDEVRRFYPDAVVLVPGAINDLLERRRRVHAMTSSRDSSRRARVVISTMHSAAKDWFLDSVSSPEHVMLVVDEVHQVGSTYLRRCLTLPASKRLGLSATPQRFGDPEGTKIILEYFGGIVPPRFGIVDAIRSGALVPYYYEPKFADLTNEERDRYQELSKKISRLAAIEDRSPTSNGQRILKHLRISRSRVAKKADHKTTLAHEIVVSQYGDGQKWIVYCEDSEQARNVHELFRRSAIPAYTYLSQQELMDESMDAFVVGGGVLVAIRCLDEGVDIPSVTHALILASSQNPRQYIQRRGRVLRRAEGKDAAWIFDVLVVPDQITAESWDSLVLAEAARALAFAKHAKNRDAESRLRMVLAGLQPHVLDRLEQVGDEVDE